MSEQGFIRTAEDVEAAIQHIRTLAGDPEAAHVAEDDLYLAVLSSIAQGEAVDPAAVAGAALSVVTVDFPRWYA